MSSARDLLLARLKAEVSDPYMGEIGMRVWDLRGGVELFRHDADLPYMMASTAKIFTIGAALALLGKDFRVSTEISASEEISAQGVLRGDLHIKGGGDPSFGSADYVKKFFYGNGTRADALLEALGRAGVRRIEGTVVVDADAFDDQVKPTGRLSALTYDRTQADEPALAAAQKIVKLLHQAGVEAEGGARLGSTPSTAHVIGSLVSPPVQDLIVPVGRRSDNFVAETLCKIIAAHVGGARGTTEAGAAIIRDFAASFGVHLEQVDGSGLAFRNKASVAGVVDYLNAVSEQPWADEFVKSLPVVGVNGTVHDRGRNTAAQGVVAAKTGTHLIPGTIQMERGFRSSAIVGFCMQGTERRLAFSIMQERPRSRYTALAGQERMLVALATYVAASG